MAKKTKRTLKDLASTKKATWAMFKDAKKGSIVMGDRRLRRTKTRNARNRKALEE